MQAPPVESSPADEDCRAHRNGHHELKTVVVGEEVLNHGDDSMERASTSSFGGEQRLTPEG